MPAPIQTATMADLFVKQGHPEQAIPIYEALLASDPGNPSLSEKLAAARSAAAKPSASAGVIPEPPAFDEVTEQASGATPMPWDAPETRPSADAPTLRSPAAFAPSQATPLNTQAPRAAAPVGEKQILESALASIQAKRRAPSPYPSFQNGGS